jgi:hypothetical protein
MNRDMAAAQRQRATDDQLARKVVGLILIRDAVPPSSRGTGYVG